MTSWRRAFRAAAEYVIWITIWGLIAGIFIFLAFKTGAGSLGFDPFTMDFYIDWSRAAVSIILTAIGYVISILGAMAALFKMISEVTAEETQRRLGEGK